MPWMLCRYSLKVPRQSRVCDRVSIVIEWQRLGTDRRGTVLAVRVVQRRCAHPHRSHRPSAYAPVVLVTNFHSCRDERHLLVVHRIADEIRGGSQFAQLYLGCRSSLAILREDDILFPRCCGRRPNACGWQPRATTSSHQPTSACQISHCRYFSP